MFISRLDKTNTIGGKESQMQAKESNSAPTSTVRNHTRSISYTTTRFIYIKDLGQMHKGSSLYQLL